MLLLLTVWQLGLSTPDSSSSLTCYPNVKVGNQMPQGCILSSKRAGVPELARFNDFQVQLPSGFQMLDLDPPDGEAYSQFHFNLVVSPSRQTGPVILTSRYTSPASVVVWDVPDGTSFVACPNKYMKPQASMICRIIARRAGVQIFAEPTFQLAGGNFKFQPTNFRNQPYNNEYNFTAFSGSRSERAEITPGVGTAFEVIVYDRPDATTKVECATSLILGGDSMTCHLIPRSKGYNCWSNSSLFQLGGGNPGAKFSLISGFKNDFEFYFTAGSESGQFNITNGVSASIPISVFADPDDTSTVVCEDSEVAQGGTTHCSITPRKLGEVVWARPDVWVLASVDDDGRITGTFDNFGPIVEISKSFLFDFTAGVFEDPDNIQAYVTDGKSHPTVINITRPTNPDHTSTVTCSNRTMRIANTVICTTVARRGGQPVWVKSSEFLLSDGGAGGSFSGMVPTVGKVFGFSYTAGVSAVNAVIRDGVSGQPFPIAVRLDDDEKSYFFLQVCVLAIFGIVVVCIGPAMFVGLKPFCCKNKKRQREHGMDYGEIQQAEMESQ